MKKVQHRLCRMIQGSLLRTGIVTVSVWASACLLLAALVLLLLFDHYIEKRFDAALRSQLHDLVAAAEVQPSGELHLAWRPSSPVFNQPFSGWYWQIQGRQAVQAQSASLFAGMQIPLGDIAAGPATAWRELELESGQRVRALFQRIRFDQGNTSYWFVVTGPTADIHDDVSAFAVQLACTMALLVLLTVLSTFYIIRRLLQPVKQLHDAIAMIRTGEASKLAVSLPRELSPVASELNSLLEHNESILSRARLQASNLAHALKNPISVLRNELGQLNDHSAAVIQEQLDKLTQNANTHLSRARLAGSINHLATQTNVAESLSDILFSMELLYKPKGLALSFSCHSAAYFRGDQHDLEEMLGNLIDNACKWAHSRVTVTVSCDDYRLTLDIRDDGPGIPAHRQDTVFKPGQRLDETTEGSGLGLPIVQDIVMLYGGSVALMPGEGAGTWFRLTLPGGIEQECR